MTAIPANPLITSRRALLFGSLLGAAGIAAQMRRPLLRLRASDPPRLDSIVPGRIGGWRQVAGGDLVLPGEAPKSDFYDQELKRVYLSGDGAPAMMLLIAYCARPQQGLLQVHDPRVCYPGAGFELQGEGSKILRLADGQRLEAQSFTGVRPDRTEQVLYWMRAGDEITRPGQDQHLAIVKTMLRGQVPDGLLVRLSALGGNPAILGHVGRFAIEMLGALSPAGRQLLLGPSLSASAAGTGG
jgi:EpsI family protein